MKAIGAGRMRVKQIVTFYLNRFPGILKPGNGVLSSWAFKLAGWGKEVTRKQL